MDETEFDLNNLSAEDLLHIRKQWKKSLASLPFEWKIGIVEKLKSVSSTSEGGENSEMLESEATSDKSPAKHLDR
jgi:ribosomal protein L29